MSYLKIREELINGKITREQFWELMKQKHLNFIDMQSLLQKTELSSLEILEDEIRVVTNEGIRLIWNPNEVRSVPSTLVNYEKHEADISDYLLKAAEGVDVIFDIGANYGFYALHFSLRANRLAEIHAFEPIPSTFDILERNIALNKKDILPVVKPHCLGLGESQIETTFFYPEYSGSGAASLRELHPHEKNKLVQANINTLDNVFADLKLTKLDLIKIDVEGSELLVIKGGIKTIKKHKPIIFAELLRKWTKPFGYHPNEVIGLLNDVGYSCWSFSKKGAVPIIKIDEETVETNFVFTIPSLHKNPSDF